jgi:DNA-binding transcriptional ArsR family regulator
LQSQTKAIQCVDAFKRIDALMKKRWTLADVRATFRLNAGLFHALGDLQRQDILLLLAEHERLNVSQIAQNMTLSRPAISHHLRVLKEAGLVQMERESRENFYSLIWEEPIGQLKLLIEQAEIACS